MGSFFKALGRIFTLPRAVRQKLAANPVEPLIAQILASDLAAAAGKVIDRNVPDPAAADALKSALPHVLGQIGLN